MNQHIFRVIPETRLVEPKFLFYALKHAIREIVESEHLHGSTMRHINRGPFLAHRCLIPPKSEQSRIVSKVDSLFAKSRQAREELGRVSHLIERYQQAILAAAFRGELTADWRVRHDAALSGVNDLSEFGLDGSERGSWTSDMLPPSWRWVAFAEMFSDETDSRRKLQQKRYQSEGRWPVVDQGEAFIGGYTDNDSLVHRSEPPVVLFGDHTQCVKFIDFRFVQGADGTKVLRPLAAVHPRYAYFALHALGLPDKGYSRHMKFLRTSYFPLCPWEEQIEVVRALEAAFSWLSRVAAECEGVSRLIERLDQMTLAKAFRGELVRQDPNDEPASVLLEHIRAERERTAQPRKRGPARQDQTQRGS